MFHKKGFTLLELIIVIIIIGILVSLGLPQFFKTAEKGRHSEGVSLLGVLRSAQLRYYAQESVFTAIPADLDVDFTTPRYFTLSVQAPAYAENAVIATATRNLIQLPSGFSQYVLTIQVGGLVECSGTGCSTLGY